MTKKEPSQAEVLLAKLGKKAETRQNLPHEGFAFNPKRALALLLASCVLSGGTVTVGQQIVRMFDKPEVTSSLYNEGGAIVIRSVYSPDQASRIPDILGFESDYPSFADRGYSRYPVIILSKPIDIP